MTTTKKKTATKADAAEATTTAIAVRDELKDYPIIVHGAAEMMKAIDVNLGDDGLQIDDLERIKIPSGGGVQFEIPSLLGGVDTCKRLEFLLLHHQTQRAYWEGKYEGGNEPPLCSSLDGKRGRGTPGGDCSKCPLAEWGSADDGAGRGQACKQVKCAYILRKEQNLPDVLTLPPTSLKPLRKHLIRISNARQPFTAIAHVATLNKVANADNIAYSQAEFAVATDGDANPLILTASEMEAVEAYAETIRAQIKKAIADKRTVNAKDFGGETKTED